MSTNQNRRTIAVNGPIIAITQLDHSLLGCSNCGHAFGEVTLKAPSSAIWKCSKCQTSTCILSDGYTTPNFRCTDELGKPVSIELVKHPLSEKTGINIERAKMQLESISTQEDRLDPLPYDGYSQTRTLLTKIFEREN